MQATKLLRITALLLFLLQGNTTLVCAQQLQWMKGTWKAESGTPYNVPPVPCTHTLEITTAGDSSFTALQQTHFTSDTTIRIAYAATGLLAPQGLHFSRGAVSDINNSSRRRLAWDTCAPCSARACTIYTGEGRVKILLVNDSCGGNCNGTIVYYRELKDFDSSTRAYLLAWYPKAPSTTTVFSPNSGTSNSPLTPPQATRDTTANIPAQLPLLRERSSKLAKTLEISAPSIDVILLDDAEIDGDIVSLYHNNVEVLRHKMLGKEVIRYSFKADKQHTRHELVLVAENLGSIPPNTALMRIRAGEKKYELTTRATMQENAMVVIEYTGE